MLVRKKIRNNWNTIKQEIIRHWPKIPMPEVDQTEGRLSSIYGLIYVYYGHVEDFYTDLEKICDQCTFEYYIDKNLEEELYDFLTPN
jgi:hypothetical protein